MELVIELFRKSDIMDNAFNKWEDREKAAQKMQHFKEHFAKGNKQQLKKLTLQQAGYHSANTAQQSPRNKTAPTTRSLKNSHTK